jgi:carbonic anhydrase
MQNLIQGVHHFHSYTFQEQRELFTRLSKSQHPQACFITCSDSRIDPNLITSTDPGDLFVVRNPGNIVPPIGTSNNGEAAAVEYAVMALGIKDIVVCGHSSCGAMKGMLFPNTVKEMPLVKSWLKYAGATERIIRENYQEIGEEELLVAAAKENVLVQVSHLYTLPVVAARMVRGLIRLHAWMYDIAQGRMFAYDSDQRRFVPLMEGSGTT